MLPANGHSSTELQRASQENLLDSCLHLQLRPSFHMQFVHLRRRELKSTQRPWMLRSHPTKGKNHRRISKQTNMQLVATSVCPPPSQFHPTMDSAIMRDNTLGMHNALGPVIGRENRPAIAGNPLADVRAWDRVCMSWPVTWFVGDESWVMLLSRAGITQFVFLLCSASG